MGSKTGPLTLPSGKTWQRPANRSYTITLDDVREATITISFGIGSVPAKLYCLGRLVRDTDGTPRTMNVRVQATTIKCKVTGKGNTGEIKASSYCKPPDAFCTNTGIHLALKHLFRHDSEAEAILSSSERALILGTVCPWLGSKGKTTKTTARQLRSAMDSAPAPKLATAAK